MDKKRDKKFHALLAINQDIQHNGTHANKFFFVNASLMQKSTALPHSAIAGILSQKCTPHSHILHKDPRRQILTDSI